MLAPLAIPRLGAADMPPGDLEYPVLLLEDTEDLRTVICLGLQLMACVSVVAAHPQQDWPAFARVCTPALILIDIAASEQDSRRALELGVGLGSSPVIYTTARARLQDRQRAFQLGATAVIPRPFDMAELAHIVTQLALPPAARSGPGYA